MLISDMDSMGCSSPSTEGTELNGSLLNSSGDVTSTRLTEFKDTHTQFPIFLNFKKILKCIIMEASLRLTKNYV